MTLNIWMFSIANEQTQIYKMFILVPIFLIYAGLNQKFDLKNLQKLARNGVSILMQVG